MISHSQFDQDDGQEEDVHMRIVITGFQVIILQFLVSLYLLIIFVVTIVKRDRHKFVIVEHPLQDDAPAIDSVNVDNVELVADNLQLLNDVTSSTSKQKSTQNQEEILPEDSISIHK